MNCMKNYNRTNKPLILCVSMIFLLIMLSVLVIIFSPWDMNEIVGEKYEGMSWGHLFGTDYLGRDLLVRVSVAFLVSLSISTLAILCGLIIGSVYGIIAGYFGGLAERIMVAIMDIFQCVPEILIAIFLMVVFNSVNSESVFGSISAMTVTLILVSWPFMGRVAKNETKKIKQMEYVVYSKIKGATTFHIIFFHILPNLKNQLLTVMSQRIPKSLMVEALLSFIGIGIQPPFPSLGKMINDGLSVIRVAPHVILFPAIAIMIIVVIFNLICECLRR